MSFKNFSDVLYVKVQDSSSINGLGKITSSTNFNLDTIRVAFYCQDVPSLGGTETIQVNLYSDDQHTKLYSSSNILNVADFVSGSSNWIGFIGFSFSELPNIGSNHLYAGMVATNYTRNDPFYMSVLMDWPLYVNQSAEPAKRGAWIEMYGY